MSMVKKLLFFLLFLTVNLVNAQDPSGLTLSEARPFCSDSGAQFPNTHDGSNSLAGPVLVEETLPDFGCLFPQLRVNPTWYFLKIETSGDLNLKLISYTSNDVRMDTDFIAWGPFSEDAFNEIINNGDGQELTGDTIVGCEKSTSQPFEEDIIINDAIVDEYYIVMITNYSGNEGYSTLEEQNPDDPNTGTTDCFVNDAPTITSTAVTTATEDEQYTYTITTEDVDGDVVTVNASGLPSWLTLSGNTLSGTPTEGETGSEITITATDDGDGALTATQTFTIVVTPVNDSPTITSIAVTTATEDIAYTYTITTEDVDGDLVTVSAIGLPSWLTLSGNTLSGTPTEGDTGSEITITATDDGDGTLTATQIFTIVVTPVNDAPTITSTVVTTATEDIAYTYTITTEDVDGDVVTVSASGLPSWLTLTDNTLSGTPTEGDTGSEITITATDDGDGALTATQIFTIVVTPVNDAPVAVDDITTVLEDAEATSIDVLANDTDEEGDPLTLLSVTTSGTGTVTVDGALLEYTPAADFNGTEEVSYTVSDGLLTSAGMLTITVTPVNDPPIAIEDIASVLENAFMTSIDVISNDIDVDGDILSLTAVSYSGLGTVVVNVDEFSVDYTPAPNFIGTEVINYSVTDGILSSEGVLKINVITPEEIQITKPELNIPKFFTPNGDGINDTWNIKWNNVSNYRIIEVNIYNRYGKILKKLTSFDNGWDGTYNGKLMPPNDYWVAIKLVPMNETKRIIIETSNFSLIR